MRAFRRSLALLAAGVLVCSCIAPETRGDSPTEVPDPSTTSTTVLTTTTTLQTTTTTVPSTTSTSVPKEAGWDQAEGEAAMATIDNYYTALNSGDLETALGIVVDRTPEARLTEKLPIAVDGLNAQFEYDCTLGKTQGVVSCVEYVTDDLYGPAGITNHATVTYRYDDGRLTTSGWYRSFVCEADPTGDALSFLMEFRVWAATNHPELERYWLWGAPIDSPLAIPCTVHPFTSAENAIEVCMIVPEFVAQSDHWPTDRP